MESEFSYKEHPYESLSPLSSHRSLPLSLYLCALGALVPHVNSPGSTKKSKDHKAPLFQHRENPRDAQGKGSFIPQPWPASLPRAGGLTLGAVPGSQQLAQPLLTSKAGPTGARPRGKAPSWLSPSCSCAGPSAVPTYPPGCTSKSLIWFRDTTLGMAPQGTPALTRKQQNSSTQQC